MGVRNLTTGDCRQIANLHGRAFQSFFLTSLGERFLLFFYRSIILDPNGMAIGLFEEEQLLAFAVGTVKQDGFYKRLLKKNFFRLGIAAIPSLLMNPKKIVRLTRNLSSKESSDPDQEIENTACLLSICVDPAKGSKGYGKQVLREFEKQVFTRSKKICLTTDAEKNDQVNNFYRANNYLLLKSFYNADRKMNLYYKNYEE
jgi:ribosomal protein S18 acetylase RimI-like enzyme